MDTTDQRRPNLTAITLAVVVTAYAIFIVLGMPDGMLGVAWPSMRATFDLAQSQMGLLLLASTVGFLITSFGVGRLFSAFGVVGVLIVATIVRGAGLVSIGLAPEAWALFLSAFVFGLGSGAIDAGLNTYFAMNLSPRLMNWLHAFFGVGATLGPILMTAVLSLGAAWRWGYVIVGVVQAALAIAIFAKAGAWKARAETGTYAAESKVTKQKSYGATLRRPIVWLNIALFFFYAGLEVTAGNWSYSIFTGRAACQ
ncbi:MAG: MFS transporter [Anaerolineales bacterium]|nr:MFS transporter [Anaerolineales bacterium]